MIMSKTISVSQIKEAAQRIAEVRTDRNCKADMLLGFGWKQKG